MFKTDGQLTPPSTSWAAAERNESADRPVTAGADPRPPLAMWGGVECTVNRVGDAFFTQLDRSGHHRRDEDLGRFAALGISALRYPVLWEITAPDGIDSADWSFADRRLPELGRLGIAPIVGLVHHGSGPPHTNLLDAGFATGLAEFAAAAAARYPWVDDWTPVNEPLTTARFSGLYGLWYPHARDDRSFVAALLNQCRATVLSMAAIRRVNPRARLIQTDDLGCTYGTAPLSGVVDFYNERRWLAWDLLCGRVTEQHPLWSYLVESGVGAEEILWFADYHAVKHDRESEFKRATLANAFHAVSACAIMMAAQYGHDALEPRSIARTYFDFSDLPRWPLSGVYVYPYETSAWVATAYPFP